MKKLAFLAAPLLLLALIAAPSAHAESPSVQLEKHLKASYNNMVQDVRNADDPAEKREIIAAFLTRVDRGLGLVEKFVPASKPTHLQAADMRAKLQGYLADLNSMDVQGPAAAGNLNNFASFLQQDIEQADGIYLSVGAIIIILLIILLVA